jgi:glycosyltransferase involved in cell wall biosynthesis
MSNSAPGPKIAFLIQGPTAPSTRIRILNMLPFFHAAGFQTVVEEYPNSLRKWSRVLPRISGAEILVVQKRLPSLLEAIFLRQWMKRLVFDFDDAVWLRNRDGDAHPSRKLRTRFAHSLKRVDLAICGNPILEARVRASCPATPTVIIPSAVPAPQAVTRTILSAEESPQTEASTRSLPQVGWVGTAINLPYLVAIEDALAAAHARIPFELVVISERPPVFREFAHMRFIPWSAETEYAHVTQFDIGLMPLADNEHSRGKCAYKALQYMSRGVPVIASDVGINREWIEKPGAGLAVNADGWVEALITLLSSAETRAQMGRSGIDVIRGGFQIEDIANRYLRAFREVLDGSPGASAPVKPPPQPK